MCVCARVYVCSMCASEAVRVRTHVHMGESLVMHERHQKLAVRMQSDASLPPVMALPLLACEGKKAVYIVPCTVTNGHNNAVRQGLVGPFLCLTSIDSVYGLTLKCAPRYLVPVVIWCDVRSALNEVIGGWSLTDPLPNISSILIEYAFNLLNKNLKI